MKSDQPTPVAWIRIANPNVLSFGIGAMAASLIAAYSALFGQWFNVLVCIAIGAACALLAYRSQAFIAIDRLAVQLYAPLRGRYQIAWNDIRYVLTNREIYAFIGADKALSVQLHGTQAAYEPLRIAINDLTRARGVPVMQTRTRPTVKTHNTKVV
jgi:hypothetical protein